MLRWTWRELETYFYSGAPVLDPTDEQDVETELLVVPVTTAPHLDSTESGGITHLSCMPAIECTPDMLSIVLSDCCSSLVGQERTKAC